MTDIPPVRTQPEPEHITAAGDLLEAILTGDLPITTRLTVADALATLYNVYPPYPPPRTPAPTQPPDLNLSTALDLAIQELRAAIDAAPSAEEAIRAAKAARRLRTLLRDEP